MRTRIAALALIVALASGCWDDLSVPLRLLAPAATDKGQVQVQFDQFYAERGGQKLYFDLYRPASASGPTPLVIMVHGGFWRYGTRTDLTEFSYDLAANGYTAAAIDYRLADGSTAFPSPVSDVLAAVRYFHDNAEQVGIDPQRMALFGRSAGAHLALLAGMTNDASIFDGERAAGELPGIKAIVDVSGPADLTADPATAVDWQIATVETFLGKKLTEAGPLLATASPATYARASGPPILIIHGDADTIVPVDQARRLVAALDAAGQQNSYLEIPGMDHIISSLWISGFAQQYRQAILDFLGSNF